MPPRGVLWPLDEHTKGKHLVLRRYLNAWLPIMGRRRERRLVFIDGFAGPGQYEGGEDGSPIIALKAFAEHTAKDLIRASLVFYFVECEDERAAHLARLVEPYRERLPTATIVVETGNCEQHLNEVLDAVEDRGKVLAPAFVMLDPFGVSDTPMASVARILKYPQSEVFISVMYEFLNRFKESGEFPPHLDELFGTTDWRQAITIENSQERREALYNLYAAQLKKAGAKYVIRFELYNENRLVYTIFFATKHELGCDKMKEAIWTVDPLSGYEFRGSRDLTFFSLMRANLTPLGEELRAKFSADGWVTVGQIERWLQTDETDYYTGQMKGALRLLEKGGEIEVDESTRQRKNSFPSPTVRLRFTNR